MSRRVVIYYVDPEFLKVADDLRKAFLKSVIVHCPNCLPSNYSISIKDAADSLKLHHFPEGLDQCDIRSFSHLGSLLKYSSEDKFKFDYDVVVILGHSTIFTIGPFFTTDILSTLVDVCSPRPSIVALLGCCSGNARYGPASILPHVHDLETIFVFYRRMVYLDEIMNTSLVLGIRNYLSFTAKFPCVKSRVMAKHAFVSAALEAPDNDPTAFVNDVDNGVTLQSFLVALKDFKCKLPKSCGIFAYFSHFTMKNECATSELLFSRFAQSKSLEEFDRKCKIELEKLYLGKVDQLYKSTTKLCQAPPNIAYHKLERWDCIGNLQFFILILLGYWGKNSYSDIRDYAYLRLNKMREQVQYAQNQTDYKLCAFIFCLVCENACLSVNNSGILDVYCQDSETFDHKHLQLLPNEPLGFPKVRDINWVKFFHHRVKDDKFLKLVEKGSDYIRIVNFKDKSQSQNYYEYEYEDFKSAVDALWIAIINDQFSEEYRMKEFKNVKQAYFPSVSTRTRFIEMWITRENTPPNKNLQLVSRCRFVFAYGVRKTKNHPDVLKCLGLLFITDSHYGSDWLPEDVVNGMLINNLSKDKVASKNDVEKVDELKKIYNYDGEYLQRGVINYCDKHDLSYFPFNEIGILSFDNKEHTWSLRSDDNKEVANFLF